MCTALIIILVSTAIDRDQLRCPGDGQYPSNIQVAVSEMSSWAWGKAITRLINWLSDVLHWLVVFTSTQLQDSYKQGVQDGFNSQLVLFINWLCI